MSENGVITLSTRISSRNPTSLVFVSIRRDSCTSTVRYAYSVVPKLLEFSDAATIDAAIHNLWFVSVIAPSGALGLVCRCRESVVPNFNTNLGINSCDAFWSILYLARRARFNPIPTLTPSLTLAVWGQWLEAQWGRQGRSLGSAAGFGDGFPKKSRRPKGRPLPMRR